MPDKITPEVRSKIMASIRRRDTALELAVRRRLFAAGYRYRLHRRDLPGAPDIVLPRFRTAIFVHGCFWHSHDCTRGQRPASNRDFWDRKLNGNQVRDLKNQTSLRSAGWRVEVIWQCSLTAGCERVLAQLDSQRRPSDSV
jgi:DNA mismatch endonuclease (patch repair protein)